jgi:predicted branched-subunit amino acid permease
MSSHERAGRVTGLRASAVVFLPTVAIGVTFGVLADSVMGAVPAVIMSALVWSGTAQFAALTALGGGAGGALAAGTGLLTNTRYMPMGFAIAPSLDAPAWRRALTGALLVDASFVIGHRHGGGFDIEALEWAAPVQYTGWVGGTALGVLGSSLLADPGRLGVDVLFPVFYLGLLLPETARSKRAVMVALLSAIVTTGLIPIVPEGVPVLAGATTALLGIRDPA